MSIGSNISDQLRHGADAIDPKQLASSVKEQGAHAAHAAADAGRDLAHKVGEQAAVVAEQAKDLTSMVSHAKDELATQVEHRGKQAARSVRSLLRGAERQVHKYTPGRRRRGLGAVVHNVTGFARRRPVSFLLIVAAIGFVGARLVSGGAGRSKSPAPRGPGNNGTNRDSSRNGSADFADSTGPLTTAAPSNGESTKVADAAGAQPGWSDAPPFDAPGAGVPANAASDDSGDEAGSTDVV